MALPTRVRPAIVACPDVALLDAVESLHVRVVQPQLKHGDVLSVVIQTAARGDDGDALLRDIPV